MSIYDDDYLSGMADYLVDNYPEMVYGDHPKEEKVSKMIWTCKDGTEIAVEDMTDRHLINAINYTERRKKQGIYDRYTDTALNIMKVELANRKWGWD